MSKIKSVVMVNKLSDSAYRILSDHKTMRSLEEEFYCLIGICDVNYSYRDDTSIMTVDENGSRLINVLAGMGYEYSKEKLVMDEFPLQMVLFE